MADRHHLLVYLARKITSVALIDNSPALAPDGVQHDDNAMRAAVDGRAIISRAACRTPLMVSVFAVDD